MSRLYRLLALTLSVCITKVRLQVLRQDNENAQQTRYCWADSSPNCQRDSNDEWVCEVALNCVRGPKQKQAFNPSAHFAELTAGKIGSRINAQVPILSPESVAVVKSETGTKQTIAIKKSEQTRKSSPDQSISVGTIRKKAPAIRIEPASIQQGEAAAVKAESIDSEMIEVPLDDYLELRRTILDAIPFEKTHSKPKKPRAGARKTDSTPSSTQAQLTLTSDAIPRAVQPSVAAPTSTSQIQLTSVRTAPVVTHDEPKVMESTATRQLRFSLSSPQSSTRACVPNSAQNERLEALFDRALLSAPHGSFSLPYGYKILQASRTGENDAARFAIEVRTPRGSCAIFRLAPQYDVTCKESGPSYAWYVTDATRTSCPSKTRPKASVCTPEWI